MCFYFVVVKALKLCVRFLFVLLYFDKTMFRGFQWNFLKYKSYNKNIQRSVTIYSCIRHIGNYFLMKKITKQHNRIR